MTGKINTANNKSGRGATHHCMHWGCASVGPHRCHACAYWDVAEVSSMRRTLVRKLATLAAVLVMRMGSGGESGSPVPTMKAPWFLANVRGSGCQLTRPRASLAACPRSLQCIVCNMCKTISGCQYLRSHLFFKMHTGIGTHSPTGADSLKSVHM